MEGNNDKQNIVDLISDSTKKTRNTLDKNVSNGVNKFFELLGATPIGRSISLYIEEAPFKLEKAREKMLKKYNKILPENIVEPSPRIALNVANEFNYCLDEKYIKEMFMSILISDMDKTKKSKVSPAYIDIVKQLSKSDAEILNSLKTLPTLSNPIIKLKFNVSNGGYYIPSNDILLIDKEKYIHIPSINIDNLSRLKIIDVDFMTFINNKSIYMNAFKYFKNEGPLRFIGGIPENLNYSKGILYITDFGKNFIDICLS